MVSYFAMIALFGCYCLNFLIPNAVLAIIATIAIAAVGLIIERYPAAGKAALT
jgi:hypothetical protein